MFGWCKENDLRECGFLLIWRLDFPATVKSISVDFLWFLFFEFFGFCKSIQVGRNLILWWAYLQLILSYND